MIERLLVPVDGSEHANRAVDLAGDLATKYAARVTLLHVMTNAGSSRVPEGLSALQEIEHVTLTESDMLRSVANEILEAASKRARDQGVAEIETEIRVGDPAQSIIDYARQHDFDLVVMGRRGLGDLKGLLLGSVTHKVAQLTECACLTVK